MHRRRVLKSVALLGTAVLAGCSTERTVGHLHGEEVDSAPADATVVSASDDRIANVTSIQQVVERAAERDGELATVKIEGKQADRAIDSLKELPHYDSSASEQPGGYYIDYVGQIVVVNWAVQEYPSV